MFRGKKLWSKEIRGYTWKMNGFFHLQPSPIQRKENDPPPNLQGIMCKMFIFRGLLFGTLKRLVKPSRRSKVVGNFHYGSVLYIQRKKHINRNKEPSKQKLYSISRKNIKLKCIPLNKKNAFWSKNIWATKQSATVLFVSLEPHLPSRCVPNLEPRSMMATPPVGRATSNGRGGIWLVGGFNPFEKY